MLFDTLSIWLIFVALCIASMMCCTRVTLRNSLLLIASYIFYLLLSWQFFWILILSTIVAFLCGIAVEKTRPRSIFLVAGITFFVGILAYLKYRNFFISTMNSLVHDLDWSTTTLILPLGISFYIFEVIGYLIDVKNQKYPASKNLVEFALFIGFFPKIVLGPIERSSHLLPQIQTELQVDWSSLTQGMQLIAWGIFKKLVMANQLGVIIEHRSVLPDTPAAMLLFVAYLYAFQLYFDFSGYTDIAIGLARLFGISLLPNFRRPYASASIAEFWRRWHMSLSLWLRDYLYIPLGGNRVSLLKRYRNVLIVFLMSGLWHGAAWTFVLWGLLHGLMMIVSMITAPYRYWLKKITGFVSFPHIDHALKVCTTFHCVVLAWIMFYSPSIAQAIHIYTQLFRGALHGIGQFPHAPLSVLNQALQGAQTSIMMLLFLLIVVAGVETVEWLKEKNALTHFFDRQSAFIRWPLYYSLLLAIILFGRYGNYTFLYVRF